MWMHICTEYNLYYSERNKWWTDQECEIHWALAWLALPESPVLLRCLSTSQAQHRFHPRSTERAQNQKYTSRSRGGRMGISALPSPYQLSYSLQMHSNQDCNFPKAKKNAHTKKTKQLPPKKDPVLYSTEQIFTHTSLQSLHCFQVFPSIPSQTKNEKKQKQTNSAFWRHRWSQAWVTTGEILEGVHATAFLFRTRCFSFCFSFSIPTLVFLEASFQFFGLASRAIPGVILHSNLISVLMSLPLGYCVFFPLCVNSIYFAFLPAMILLKILLAFS